MQVFIYNGEGASEFCVKETLKTFSSMGCAPQLIYSDTLGVLSVPKMPSIFVMPGGRDLPYLQDIGHEGVKIIKEFVNSGGTYLGFCAGAYFAAHTVEFELNTAMEVKGDRPLKFYPGVAYGTLYPETQFVYGSEKGARVSRVKTDSGQYINVYYNGGCAFRNHGDVDVLCWYTDVVGTPPAVVCVKHGLGQAILSGVHFEISPEGALDEGVDPSVVVAMETTNVAKILFMKKILGIN